MGHQFNSMDKEMSWDGYIWIYRDLETVSEKEAFDDKIPVQIKGHIDEKTKYINKERITYPVSLKDLQVYFRDRGVLYFIVFLSKDGKKREIFYSSLFPVKIKSYLEQAERKGNRSNKNIPFTKLRKDPKEFYRIAKQFSCESKKQGFGHEQIVQNTISLDDLSKVKSISATVVGASDELEFLRGLDTGDVEMYASIEGCPIQLPIEWTDNVVHYMSRKVSQNIRVLGRTYYDSYKVTAGSNGDFTIHPSENLTLDFHNGKFNFTPTGKMTQLKIDAEFLLATNRATEIIIGNQAFPYANPSLPEALRKDLDFFIKAGELISSIDASLDFLFSELREKNLQPFYKLIDIINGKRDQLLDSDTNLYNWNWDGKYYPLIIRKGIDKKHTIQNAIYSREFNIYVSDEKENHYVVPKISVLDKKVVKSLYRYDVECFELEMRNAELNECSHESFNMATLNLIHAYDATKEAELLDIAEVAVNRMGIKFGYSASDYINLLQIKKRRDPKGSLDFSELERFEVITIPEKCGIALLKGEYSLFEEEFSNLKDDEQEFFEKLPIYSLYENKNEG